MHTNPVDTGAGDRWPWALLPERARKREIERESALERERAKRREAKRGENTLFYRRSTGSRARNELGIALSTRPARLRLYSASDRDACHGRRPRPPVMDSSSY